MSEFFLELFSEEIPSNLQQDLREDLLKSFNDLFLEKSILFKKSSSYSTPNRLVVLFEGVQKNVVLKSEEIKGPNIKSPEVALDGFVRSNKILKKNLYQKKTDKGEFYFFKTKSKKLHTHELLEEFIPILLFIILLAFCIINSILALDILCNAEKGPDFSHHWLLNEENCSISFLSTVLLIIKFC